MISTKLLGYTDVSKVFCHKDQYLQYINLFIIPYLDYGDNAYDYNYNSDFHPKIKSIYNTSLHYLLQAM